MALPPDRKEVQEFKFKQFCSLRVFPTNKRLSRQNPLNIVATSTKFGLIFVGIPTGVQCIPLSNVIELRELKANGRGVLENYKRREINLECLPTHIAVNSSGDLLGVVSNNQDCPVFRVYFIKSLASPNIEKLCELRLSSTPGVQVLDLQWNPAIPTTVGAVMSDGSALVAEINIVGGNPTIHFAPGTTQATCLCWSPKGKQVVVGSKIGTLTQFKPDLKAVKSYPPLSGSQMEIVSVHWLSSFQFIAVYKEASNPQARSNIMIVNVPKGAEQSFINYEDICFGSDTLRHEHFFIHLASWNLLLVSTGNGLEVSVLYHDNGSWVQWMQDEGARAELPQTKHHDDVFTVGMTLNTNVVKPILIGDNETIPPMPFLLLMSEEGVLCLFYVINLFPNTPGICNASEDFPDKYFSIPDVVEHQNLPQPTTLPEKPVFPSLGGSGDGAASTTPQFGLFGQKSSLPPLQSDIPKLSIPQFGAVKGSVGIFGGAPQEKLSDPTKAPVSNVQPITQVGFGSMQFSSPAVAPALATSQSNLKAQSTVPPAPSIVSGNSVSTGITPGPTKDAVPPITGPPPVDNTTILNEVYKEVQAMKILLNNFHLDLKTLRKLVNDRTSLPSIAAKLDDLERFDKDLRETTHSEQCEVNSLRVSLLEMWSWLENIKARQRQASSQSYLEAVESKDLDPFLKKLMKAIDQNSVYIDTKMKEATAHLNSLWEEQKEPGSAKNFDLPHMEAIFEMMALNKSLLMVQQARINDLESRLSAARKACKLRRAGALNTSSPNWGSPNWSSFSRSNEDKQINVQADKLLQTRISRNDDSNRSLKETSTRYIALAHANNTASAQEEASLWKWHKSHKVIQTKASKVCVPNNEVLNRSLATPIKSPNHSIETTDDLPTKTINKNLFVGPCASSFSLSHDLSSMSVSPLVASTPVISKKVSEKIKPSDEDVGTKTTLMPKIIPTTNPVPKNVVTSLAYSSSVSSAILPSVPIATSNMISNTKTDANAVFGTTSQPFLHSKDTLKEMTSGVEESLRLKENQSVSKENMTSSETPKTTNIFGFKLAASTNTQNYTMFSNPVTTVGEQDKSSKLLSHPPVIGTASGAPFSLGSAFSSNLPNSSLPSLFSTPNKSITQTPPSSVTTSPSATSSFPTLTGSSDVSGSTVTTSNTSTAFGVETSTTSSWFSSNPIKFAGNTSGDSSSATAAFNISKPSTIFGGAGSTGSLGAPLFSNISSSLSTVNPNQTKASITPSIPTTSSLSPFEAKDKAGSSIASSASESATVPDVTTPPSIATPIISPTPPAKTFSVTTSATPDKSTATPSSIFSFASASLIPVTTVSTVPSLFSTPQAITVSSSPSPSPTTNIDSPTPSETTAVVSTTAPSSTSTAVTPSSTLFLTTQKSPALFSGTPSVQPAFSSSSSTPQLSFGGLGTTSPVFTTSNTSTQPSFSSTTNTPQPQPVFGAPSTTVTQSVFGMPSTTTVPSVFGTPSSTSTQPVFGTPPTTTTQPNFVSPITLSQATFSNPATTTQSIFISTTNYSTPTSSQSVFGTPVSTPSAFSSPVTSSVFGAPTTTNASVFGATNALSNSYFFGSPTTTASAFGSSPATNVFRNSSSFPSPSTTTSSNVFGAPICSPNVTTTSATTGNIFGCTFGQKSGENTFGGTPSFGSFTSSPGTFGSSGGSMFGNGSTFGQTNQQGSIFQSASSPGLFGSSSTTSGSFSGSGQNVEQSGFSTFGRGQQVQSQQTRTFGASGGAVFGGQATFSEPAFGGLPTFGGSPTKQFGTSTPPAPSSFGTPTQSSTFENLAGQNTVSFGNLAQNQQPAFGGGGATSFGQQQPPQQQQSTFNNSSSFGGSSFTSWR